MLFLFTGYSKPVKVPAPLTAPLKLENEGELLAEVSGFAENAVFPTTTEPALAVRLKRFGSWLGSDQSLGAVKTSWFRAAPRFNILIAGYPSGHGCQLFIETQQTNGATSRIPVSLRSNPGESWEVRTIAFANPAVARFRIVAVDASTAGGGWVAFSQPFLITGANNAQLSKQLALVLLTTAAALVAFLAPGLALRRGCHQSGRRLAFLWIPVPGFLGLALLGLLCWVGPHSLSARRTSQLVLGPVFFYALYRSVRFPIATYTTELERRALLVVVVLSSLGIAKASYSIGPEGELYGGQVSRTLEVGGRSDSRISYHVVQLVASRSRPYSDFAFSLLSPWNFSSRGPLAALAASPIVLAAPIQAPKEIPGQPWTVFDPQGFGAYRIVMIVMACCSLTAVFGVAGLFLDSRWAFLAFLVTATTPFIVHETYFTWPKLEAVWFVLLAAYLIIRGRYFLAGLLLGIGYLCHPLALFSLPALLGVVFLSQKAAARKFYKFALQASLLFLGLGFWIAIWALINRKHYSQSGFLNYFQQTDGANWFQTRWNSICNTLLPLNLFLLHRSHPSLNSVDGESPAIVQFYMQYWCTLPFGAGIAYFFFLLRFLYAGFFRARAWLILVFVLPFAFFAAYWGPVSTGMLREGLHSWVVGLMIFSVVMWRKNTFRPAFSAACCIALLLRGAETLLMLLLPSMLSQLKFFSPQYLLSDVCALLVIASATAWLYLSTFNYARRLSAAITSKHVPS